jgi:aspartate/methionine/tyrosine aminotransferase
MRFEISRGGSGLTYEIRNIVPIAHKLKEYGVKIIWENIGDPVQKGEEIPAWMKEVVAETIKEDRSFAYSPTKGVDETREFLARRVNARGKAQITADDIIFFNGLGDAIARSYSSLQVDARMIMPEPTYSTHFMAEVLHASFPPNTYRMNPYSNWYPDIREIEQKVKSHKSIVGILLINPTIRPVLCILWKPSNKWYRLPGIMIYSLLSMKLTLTLSMEEKRPYRFPILSAMFPRSA